MTEPEGPTLPTPEEAAEERLDTVKQVQELSGRVMTAATDLAAVGKKLTTQADRLMALEREYAKAARAAKRARK